jgi:phosphoribosyl-AMP cyclohydrolase / phosphoribosyl-ATP pyrophosphohydrolase
VSQPIDGVADLVDPPDPGSLSYDPQGLIVAVIQEASSGTVLMVAWMDREAVARTIESGEAHFWSRSRKTPWHKGETSGNVLHVERMQADCDADALLLSVHASGPACHTGRRSCFAEPATLLDQLTLTLNQRRAHPSPGSYTAQLFRGGHEAILRKVGEEAVEVLLAGFQKDDAALISEVADLWFHTWVLLVDRGLTAREILEVLAQRRRPAVQQGS